MSIVTRSALRRRSARLVRIVTLPSPERCFGSREKRCPGDHARRTLHSRRWRTICIFWSPCVCWPVFSHSLHRDTCWWSPDVAKSLRTPQRVLDVVGTMVGALVPSRRGSGSASHSIGLPFGVYCGTPSRSAQATLAMRSRPDGASLPSPPFGTADALRPLPGVISALRSSSPTRFPSSDV